MATNFLFAAGTGGYTTTPFSVMTTELNTLTSTSTATSSVNGTSGKFTQTSSGSSIWGFFWFKSGGTFTPTSGASINGWYLNSTDTGTTYEIGSAIGRAPDFIIPLPATALASGNIFYSPLCKLWIPNAKIFVQNASGASLPASGNIITCGPVATQY